MDISERLFVAFLCVYAHNVVLLPQAARCLPRRPGRWPCGRCWRLVIAAGPLPASGRSVVLGLQAVRCLVRLWVVGCAGARDDSGLQPLADLRGACSVSRRAFRGIAAVEALPGLAGTDVLLIERRAFGVGRVLLFDIQGWLTLLLSGLLA